MYGKYQDMCIMQQLLNKQKLLQLQHQRQVCETIVNAVASAEKLAMKLSRTKEYSEYDPINSASFKNDSKYAPIISELFKNENLKKEYSKYDPMNIASFKNENQLEKQLALQVVLCQCGLIAFNKYHEKFIFPDRRIKQEMINDLKKWSLLVKNRPKALESYKILIELIEGNTVDIPENL